MFNSFKNQKVIITNILDNQQQILIKNLSQTIPLPSLAPTLGENLILISFLILCTPFFSQTFPLNKVLPKFPPLTRKTLIFLFTFQSPSLSCCRGFLVVRRSDLVPSCRLRNYSAAVGVQQSKGFSFSFSKSQQFCIKTKVVL